MLPDLDSLRLFLRTADLGSLTKAAATSHIAVAAASRRIAQLEHMMRTKLLVRTARGVVLTPAGELLRVHGERLLEEALSLQAAMTAHLEHKQDVLRLFANTSAVTWALPADLADFRARYPEYEIELVERKSRHVVEAVQNGDADIGIFNLGPGTEGLRCHEYRSDRLALIVPPGHPLASGEVSFEQVLDHELISLEQGGDLSSLLREKAAALQKPLRLRLQVKSFHSVCRVIKSGLGVGVMPLRALEEITTLLNLCAVPLSDDWAIRPLRLCVRDHGPSRPALQRLIEHLVGAEAGTRPNRTVPAETAPSPA